MHILLSISEFNDLEPSCLPNDTTLVVSDESDEPIKAYKVSDGEFVLTRDFVEEDRPWKKGEAKKFIKGKTKEDVLEYFLGHDDVGPHREWEAMNNLEYELFSFVRHAGSYRCLDDDTRYNMFKISLNQDSDLEKAKEEVSWVLDNIAEYYLNVNPIIVDVFEHTLSAHGIYEIHWDRLSKFDVIKTTYGRPEIIKTLDSMEDMLVYIAKYHYYERTDGEDDYEDDDDIY